MVLISGTLSPKCIVLFTKVLEEILVNGMGKINFMERLPHLLAKKIPTRQLVGISPKKNLKARVTF